MRGGAGITSDRIILRAALVALALVVMGGDARAAAGDDADVAARYAFIDAELARGEPYARGWWTVWAVGYSASVAGGVSLAILTTSYDLKVDSYVNAAKSALALGALTLSMRDPFTSRGELGAMDASSADARAARLARAEAMLEKSAADESLSTGWLAQVASLGVNLAGGAVLWFGYGQRGLAIANVGLGAAVGELEIFTAPRDAVDSLRRYRAGDLTPGPARRAAWSVTVAPGGGAVRLVF